MLYIPQLVHPTGFWMKKWRNRCCMLINYRQAQNFPWKLETDGTKTLESWFERMPLPTPEPAKKLKDKWPWTERTSVVSLCTIHSCRTLWESWVPRPCQYTMTWSPSMRPHCYGPLNTPTRRDYLPAQHLQWGKNQMPMIAALHWVNNSRFFPLIFKHTT